MAGGTTSRSCRRTPRVSPLLRFGATLRSPSPSTDTPRCELRAGPLRWVGAVAHASLPVWLPASVPPRVVPVLRSVARARVLCRRPTSAPATSASCSISCKALAKRTAPDVLKPASQPYRDMPEVVIPLYERIVADSPNDAQAMVVLANAYWLTGRGPERSSNWPSRAKEIDPQNRGAWHLWALAESDLAEAGRSLASRSRSGFRAISSRAPRWPTTPRVWRTTRRIQSRSSSRLRHTKDFARRDEADGTTSRARGNSENAAKVEDVAADSARWLAPCSDAHPAAS